MGETVTNWRESSASGHGETCVEVASANAVHVRDTTDRGGFTLSVSLGAWQTFTASLR
jgi:hypothetical protein